jgi:predicted RNA binding protein YcfA (HicA-like mRNA interferase family)
MALPQHVWKQIKNLTKDDLIAALLRDGWKKDPASRNATISYIKEGTPNKRVVIHYHPGQTCGPGLLKALLADIGWNEKDLRRLKLIK